jgi:hypothetical protein
VILSWNFNYFQFTTRYVSITRIEYFCRSTKHPPPIVRCGLACHLPLSRKGHSCRTYSTQINNGLIQQQQSLACSTCSCNNNHLYCIRAALAIGSQYTRTQWMVFGLGSAATTHASQQACTDMTSVNTTCCLCPILSVGWVWVASIPTLVQLWGEAWLQELVKVNATWAIRCLHRQP